ncbi:formate dehydrogenase major subunit [Texcoconibacillus texcoconensis]|uniref:Formate dehydrogenase major subunit n=2 Tax=Texcoconibacillus texcoconensis TaxID=1095777 RepID=A0A840QN84_9BACI|nr:formate dehydrogenase major subunit [Texcoconibacillus texcoconensis]
MTNHWNDLKHTDCALIIGGNPAANHPISMRHLQKARDERGAKLLSVDPRYTHTSSKSDLYAQLRSGTDIAFMGGLINYAIENGLYHEEYVKHYTNASFLVTDDYAFDEGIFSGYDEGDRSYDNSQWVFQTDDEGNILKDESLSDPRCVFQLLKKHFSRYDIDTVISITGTSKEDFIEVAETFCGTADPNKTGTIMYAMGTTQHTKGSQNVRSYAIIQLLLGNVGRPGGGVNAMRGECNVQGSTDFALLFHLMPGYLSAPNASENHRNLEAYKAAETPSGGYWENTPNFLVSLLKAYYGDKATSENDFGYDYFPKGRRNYSHISLFEAMFDGEIKGMFTWGQNPVVGGPNSRKEKKAMENLDWFVSIDLWETETAAFWTEQSGADPTNIDTEVFMLPACGPYEKEGTVSNSGRWMQYRYQAIEPKNDARSDAWIVHNLANRIKKLYEGENNPVAEPIQALSWDFGQGDYPEIDLIAREINGYDLKTGRTVESFAVLKDDGSTSCGNWIYSGFYPDAGPGEEKNLSKRRDDEDTGMDNYLNWSYAWPLNRRVLYNRASADPQGNPWASDKEAIWWDASQSSWVGHDVPDFGADVDPNSEGGTDAFIMRGYGKASLYSADGMTDGPFPEHYEPYESPISDNPFSKVDLNPAVKIWDGKMNDRGSVSEYPIVATNYRLTEHWQSGSMTRNQEWVSELMPYMFIEMSEELAEEKGISERDKVVVESARGSIEAYAMVTKRFKPFKVKGKKVHQIGMPWHYGYQGIATGEIANVLTPHIGDANTMIPEYKAFLCDVRRANS